MDRDKNYYYRIDAIEEWVRKEVPPLEKKTYVSFVSENGYEHLLHLTNSICFEKEDPVIDKIMEQLQIIERKRIYSIVFAGLQNGIILIEKMVIGNWTHLSKCEKCQKLSYYEIPMREHLSNIEYTCEICEEIVSISKLD